MLTILNLQNDDEKFIVEHIAVFRKYSDEKLVEAYNREVKCGIVGVRAQALYLYSLREVMRERFKTSPIFYESNIMGMQGEVRLVDGRLWFKRKMNLSYIRIWRNLRLMAQINPFCMAIG